MFNVTRNDVCNEEEDLLKYWECLFNAWKSVPDQYRKFMDVLQDYYNEQFVDYAPLQIVGDFWGRANKTLVVSLQPGLSDEKYLSFEQEERKMESKPEDRTEVQWGWQLIFALRYFKLLGDKKLVNETLDRLDKLMKYYEHSATQKKPIYDVLYQKVVEAYVVPFYGENISKPKLNGMVTQSFKRIRNFFLGKEFDLILLEGRELFEKLVEENLLTKIDETVSLVDDQDKESSLDEFIIELVGLKQKGIVLPENIALDDSQLKKVASAMRRVSRWNRENYWKNNF